MANCRKTTLGSSPHSDTASPVPTYSRPRSKPSIWWKGDLLRMNLRIWPNCNISTKPPFGVRSCEVAIIWPEESPKWDLQNPWEFPTKTQHFCLEDGSEFFWPPIFWWIWKMMMNRLLKKPTIFSRCSSNFHTKFHVGKQQNSIFQTSQGIPDPTLVEVQGQKRSHPSTNIVAPGKFCSNAKTTTLVIQGAHFVSQCV